MTRHPPWQMIVYSTILHLKNVLTKLFSSGGYEIFASRPTYRLYNYDRLILDVNVCEKILTSLKKIMLVY